MSVWKLFSIFSFSHRRKSFCSDTNIHCFDKLCMNFICISNSSSYLGDGWNFINFSFTKSNGFKSTWRKKKFVYVAWIDNEWKVGWMILCKFIKKSQIALKFFLFSVKTFVPHFWLFNMRRFEYLREKFPFRLPHSHWHFFRARKGMCVEPKFFLFTPHLLSSVSP